MTLLRLWHVVVGHRFCEGHLGGNYQCCPCGAFRRPIEDQD